MAPRPKQVVSLTQLDSWWLGHRFPAVSPPPTLAFYGSLLLCREMQEGGYRTTAFRPGMPFSSSSQSQIDEASPKCQKPSFGSGLGGPTMTYLSSLLEIRVIWPAPGRCRWRVCILDSFSILLAILLLEAFYPHCCKNS